jgi:hypothetical protein
VLSFLGVLVVIAGVSILSPLSASASSVSAGATKVKAMPTCSSTTAISYGAAPAVANIAVAGDVACFTFRAMKNDLEFTDVAVTSGSVGPFLDIFDSGGTSICGGPYEGPGGCSVNSTGTWTIELSDSSGTHTGKMNIAIQRLDSAAGCASISYGSATVKGKVKSPASITCYTFTGAAGDVIYAHVVGIKGTLTTPELTLGAPDASEPCGSVELGTMECSLTETGTQSMLLYSPNDGKTGTFDFSIQRVTDPVSCPALTKNGPKKSGAVATIGQVECFEFTGKNKEAVTITMSSVTGSRGPLMDLFNPAGTSVAAGPMESLSTTLNSAGKWVMLIEDNAGPGLGTFKIALT